MRSCAKFDAGDSISCQGLCFFSKKSSQFLSHAVSLQMGADADQTICDYSNKELLIPPEETEMIPRSALIYHCLSLYERLSWHRSKRLVQNGQNPFKNVLVCGEFDIIKFVFYWTEYL